MERVNLGKHIEIGTGKLDANKADTEGKYPFFTCSKEPLKINQYSYDCECVLVAGNGDLNVKYYKGKFDAYQRTYIIRSKNDAELDTKYLYYLIDSNIEQLRRNAIGGVIKYIKLKNLTDIKFQNRNIAEQRNIVVQLDKVQKIIDKRKKQIEELEDLIKCEFVEMFGNPILNNRKWNTFKMWELGTLERGTSKHRPRNAPELLGGKYPLIQTGDVSNSDIYIKDYKATYSELGLKQSKMWKKNTLCITIAANIAQTSILTFDACFPDSIVGFLTNGKVNNIFMHYWFAFFQKKIDRQATQVAQKNINLKILNNLEVIVPTIDLQNQFAEIVKQIDKKKEEIQKNLKEMQQLKESIIEQYFST